MLNNHKLPDRNCVFPTAFNVTGILVAACLESDEIFKRDV